MPRQKLQGQLLPSKVSSFALQDRYSSWLFTRCENAKKKKAETKLAESG